MMCKKLWRNLFLIGIGGAASFCVLAAVNDPTARPMGGAVGSSIKQALKSKVEKNEIEIDMIVTSPKGSFLMAKGRVYKVGDYIGSNKVVSINPGDVETGTSFRNAKNILLNTVYTKSEPSS
jgi:hypothetical protein